jgi:hypothetical protein
MGQAGRLLQGFALYPIVSAAAFTRAQIQEVIALWREDADLENRIIAASRTVENETTSWNQDAENAARAPNFSGDTPGCHRWPLRDRTTEDPRVTFQALMPMRMLLRCAGYTVRTDEYAFGIDTPIRGMMSDPRSARTGG